MSENQACDVPLIEQLRSVDPKGHEWIELIANDGTHAGSSNVPYGALCHKAADRIEFLEGQCESVSTGFKHYQESSDDKEGELQSLREQLAKSEAAAAEIREALKKLDEVYLSYIKDDLEKIGYEARKPSWLKNDLSSSAGQSLLEELEGLRDQKKCFLKTLTNFSNQVVCQNCRIKELEAKLAVAVAALEKASKIGYVGQWKWIDQALAQIKGEV